MSESDSDSDIQADIQALTQALALPTTSKLQQEFVFDNESRSDSFGSVEASDDEHINFICENEDNESLNAYEMNAKLIRGLTIAKKKLNALLQECERKIKELDERMSVSSEGSCSHTIRRISLTNAGMPYFKDKNHFRAPKNYDTKLKESRGELFMSFLKKPSRWTERDREVLLKAIHNEAIESVLSKGFNEMDKEISSDVEGEKGPFTVPRNFKEMVGKIGEREFDWHKISRIDFEDKHSPGECQAMWNVYLHPDFNKNEWTPAEDNRLLKCAKECKYQDWDTITQILGTNRSAYQCFIRYNTIKEVPSVGCPWPKEEDKCLVNIINHFKIGDYIPWCEIANHMRNRTKQQIYNRWHYRKAPHLRKGRFTYLETKTLLDAVEKYGPNFCKISNNVMPHRSSIQLNERYNTIMLSLTCDKMWTLDDDEKLLQLQQNLKNNWSEIALHFSNKSRTQVRHRFHALQKYLDRNIYLEDIPRPSSSNNIEQTCRDLISLRRNKDEEKSCIVNIDDIQLRLYEILSSPLQVINSEKSCDSEQLSTRKLYDMLNILNANLDFTNSFMNFACLNSREKQLLASLKEYINFRNNKLQNHEEVEKFRMQMFGDAEEVSENSFIPPLPFDGYVKTLKKKGSRENQSIDCERIDVDEKFIIDVPTKFSAAFYIRFFINNEEEHQFHKFGQLLISDTYEYDEQRTNLCKRVLKCHLTFDKTCTSASEYYNYGLDYMDGELITVRQRKWPSKFQIPIAEYNEDIKKLFSDVITPNRATLLGLKNLLVWKLLYEYEYENCDLFEMSESDQEEMEETNCPKSTEYQLLQTRLSQLFKLPIGLSNTKLEIKTEPKTSFLINKKNASKKRKFEDTEELSDTDNYNVLNSSFEFDSNVKTADLPIVRSCKVVNKKLKIIA